MCVRALCVYSAHRGQKKLLYLLEVELQTIVDFHLCPGDQSQDQKVQEQKVLLSVELLQP